MTFVLVSLIEEFKVKNKNRNSFLSSLVGYGMPIFFIGLGLISAFNQINIIYSFITCILLFGIILLVTFIYLKNHFYHLFLDVEEGD